MFDTEKLMSSTVKGRNTVQGNYKSAEMGPRMPDQTRQSQFIKELIELRAVQNNVKNKLRKVLFNADPCKSIIFNVAVCNWNIEIEKQGVMASE